MSSIAADYNIYSSSFERTTTVGQSQTELGRGFMLH